VQPGVVGSHVTPVAVAQSRPVQQGTVSEHAAPPSSHWSQVQEVDVAVHGPVAPSASCAWQMVLQQLALEVHAKPKFEQVCGGEHDPPVQVFVLSQQSEFWAHGWETPAQVVPACWHVPPVAPGGMAHEVPTQQSASRVQLAP